MNRPPIRLIRQALLRAPLDLLAEQRAPIAELLVQARLPARLQEPEDGFLPARHLLGFLAGGARYLGAEDFAFRAVLRAPRSRLGSWGSLIRRGWRLRDALQCFCAQLVQDAPFLEAGLELGPEHAWLWRRRDLPPKDPFAERQGEQYTLASMLQVVRTAAGRSWTPPGIRTESRGSDWVLGVEDFGSSSVSFGDPVMALAVPYELLELRLPRETSSEPTPAGGDAMAPALDLAGSLQQGLAPLLDVVPLSLELAAEVAETSPRTLRRRLAEEGTSWRRILERIRFEACEAGMLEPSRTLTEIATDLGYADQAHFTRAFSRWTGESPRAYRDRLSGRID